MVFPFRKSGHFRAKPGPRAKGAPSAEKPSGAKRRPSRPQARIREAPAMLAAKPGNME